MKSTWPIMLGIAGVVIAAFWYDARNEAVASGLDGAPTRAPVVASTRVR